MDRYDCDVSKTAKLWLICVGCLGGKNCDFKSIGQHDLWIWRGDTKEIIHAKVTLFLVKWVVIEIYTDSVKIKNEFMPPLFQ